MITSKTTALTIIVILMVVLLVLTGLKSNSQLCSEKRAEVFAILATPAKCHTNEDCIVTSLACPFSCYAPLTGTLHTEVRKKMQEYYADCLPCEHSCQNSPRGAICEEGACQLVY